MKSSFYDTSSSLYPNDKEKKIQYNQTFRTPSPTSQTNRKSFLMGSSSTYIDDVYRPYITPPTPFEKTTQELDSKIAAVNPYAQSLWYSFRGNDGSEIEKYKKVPVAAVPEPIKIKRSQLLPSLMAKKEIVSAVETNYHNYDSHGDNDYYLHEYDDRVSSLQIIQNYDYEVRNEPTEKKVNTIEEELLKPLNYPPPYEFITIQSTMVKKLACLLEISFNFKVYIDEHKILMNSKVRLYLFSNIKTLLIIHQKFFDAIVNNTTQIDIEELIYDHLQRLYHVYPSYLSSMPLRNHFTKRIINNNKFEKFLGIESNNHQMKQEFYDLIISPSKDFHRLLIFLNSYIGGSSPRIKVAIDKFLKYYENPIEDGLQFEADEPLYLDVPNLWKNEHKSNWKEIFSFNSERQIAYYLRFELKNQFQQYCTVIKFIKFQIDQISKISITNNYIAKGFIKLQINLPKSNYVRNIDYSKNLAHVDSENEKIYDLLKAFTIFIGDESFKEIECMICRANKICKGIIHQNNQADEGESYTVDKIFEVYQFKKLFEERFYLIFVKFVSFFKSYLEVIDYVHKNNNCFEDTSGIVESFRRQQLQQRQCVYQEETQLAEYNKELARACTKGKIMKRFYK
jgi:hypothetical protein